MLSRNDINLYTNLYLKRPNIFPLFAFSWGRLFRTELIKKKKIFFNENMRTFEDVDFNFKYLTYVENIMYLKKSFTNHLIDTTYTSSTMNVTKNYKQFFGYKDALKSISNYLYVNKITKDIEPKIAHAYSSLTIIQFIRLALKYDKKNKSLIKKLFFELVNDSSFQDKFLHYRPNKGDSKIIPILIKMKFSWLLLQFCKIKSRIRY